MNKKMNTVIDFEFCDGTKEKITLQFYALYQLKAKKENLYKRYCAIIAKPRITDELEMITVIYTAYACAHLSEIENIMSEEEFMIKCGCDREAINTAYRDLVYPKKRKASDDHSESRQEE